MIKALVSLALGMTLGTSFDAAACSVMPEPPAVKFESSHSAVLAVPLDNSIKPKMPRIVVIKVLCDKQCFGKSLWPGKASTNQEIRSRQGKQFEVSPGSCGSPMRFRGQEVRLLYLSEREPYAEFYALRRCSLSTTSSTWKGNIRKIVMDPNNHSIAIRFSGRRRSGVRSAWHSHR